MATDSAAIVHKYEDPDDPDAWAKFLTARDTGERFECDKEMFYYWLEVLPPVWMGRTVVLDGQPVKTSFGVAEGSETVTAFWKRDGRFFGQRTDIMNPYRWG